MQMFHLLTAPTFGSKHLIGLGYVVLIIIVGLQLLKKDYTKQKLLVFIVLFFGLEILKIGFLIIRDGSFPMNHIPLHLCSIPLYAYPAMYFAKEGSYFERVAKTTSVIVVIAAGITALLQPQNIIGENETWFPATGNFLPLISFTFHGLMILAPLYLLRSKAYQPKYLDFFYAIQFTFGLMLIALLVNFTLDQDFMLLYKGNGSPLQFLLDQGQFIYTTTMIVLGLLVITIVSVTIASIYQLRRTT
jgi:uncharacterized membrane protein YwaF